MANVVKYAPQTITVGGNSERLATNGHYTGQHKGSITQDANVDGDNTVYQVENGVVRYGTIMGDNAAGSMPKLGVYIKEVLTGCTSSNSEPIVSKEDNLSVTYTAAEDYDLPNAITVKIGGTTATVSTDYTWTVGTGVLTIAKAKITGDLEITVTATESESE